MKLLLLAVLIGFVGPKPAAAFQSTTYTIKALTRTEQDLLPTLFKYLESLLEQHQIFRTEIDQILQDRVTSMPDLNLHPHSHAQAAQHLKYFDRAELANEFSSHPFKAYKLLARSTSVWSKLGHVTAHVEAVDKELKGKVAELQTEDKRGRGFGFPNKTHLEEAMSSLILLQRTYNLSVEELNTHHINGRKRPQILLKPQHYLEIGRFALDHRSYTAAIEFFHFGLERIRVTEPQDGVTGGISTDGACQPLNPLELEVESQLQTAIDQHDSKLSRGAFEPVAGNKNPFHYQHALGNPSRESFRNRVPFSALPDSSTSSGVYASHELLCNNQQIRPASYTSTLVCKLEADRNPYFAIQPAKVEYFSYDPLLIQVHDVLTQAHVDRLVTGVEPYLTSKSEVVKEEKDMNRSYFGRTSSSVSVDDFDPRLQRAGSLFHGLTRRIEALTGLNTHERTAAEVLQVANYGPGAFYMPHYDSSDPLTKSYEEMERLVTYYAESGERIATFMIYLNDDFEGGNTAFPKLGMSVKPVRGSGVFWYNLRSDGSQDPLSLHAGCPVRYGSKWVANKWIRVNDQMFIRKCDMARGE